MESLVHCPSPGKSALVLVAGVWMVNYPLMSMTSARILMAFVTGKCRLEMSDIHVHVHTLCMFKCSPL